MRFGVQIENHVGFAYETVLAIARETEKRGFDGLFICHLPEEQKTRPGSLALTPE